MARSYTHIKQYYEEMEQMHQGGHSCREIGEKLLFTKEQVKECLRRSRRKAQKEQERVPKLSLIHISPKRELDMLLTTGEQVSVSLMAMAMHALGVPAVSLNAYQVMMHSTSRYGNARFKRIDSERIRHELDSRKIVIVTGFQGVNKYDDYTTLGRGGSDTTAVALAAALRADACEIYTDVDGVYTCLLYTSRCV